MFFPGMVLADYTKGYIKGLSHESIIGIHGQPAILVYYNRTPTGSVQRYICIAAKKVFLIIIKSYNYVRGMQ